MTMHKIAKSLDRGDILAQRKYDIQPGNDSVDIYLKSGRQALSMVKELMEDFDRVWTNARPQKEKLPYWNRPKKEALALNHGMTVEEARGVYRCFNKMTTVCIDGRFCYVDGFAAGSVLLGQDDSIICLSVRTGCCTAWLTGICVWTWCRCGRNRRDEKQKKRKAAA